MSGLRFCSRCNSMLMPREDKNTRTLMLHCRSCDEQEVADSNIIYQHFFKKKAESKLEKVDNAVVSDPTLPRTKDITCSKCGRREAVFFQADHTTGEDMGLIFVCVHCKHKWLG
jgi:DNA-directed RNA polymerase II subunit RPB9